MVEQEFLEAMAELMDTEEALSLSTKLDDIPEWDSLSYVAFQANARVKWGKDIIPKDVKEARVLGDLFVLVK